MTSVGEAVAAMRDGKADAFALSRDTLPTYVKQVPGSLMVDGAFQKINVSIAVAKGKPAALAAVSEFLTEAKKSGLVRRVFDTHGLLDAQVAPLTE